MTTMMKCERTTNQSTAQYHRWKSYISELTIKLNRSYFQIATKTGLNKGLKQARRDFSAQRVQKVSLSTSNVRFDAFWLVENLRDFIDQPEVRPRLDVS